MRLLVFPHPCQQWILLFLWIIVILIGMYLILIDPHNNRARRKNPLDLRLEKIAGRQQAELHVLELDHPIWQPLGT